MNQRGRFSHQVDCSHKSSLIHQLCAYLPEALRRGLINIEHVGNSGRS